MPNWCENTLIISGDEDEIRKFKAKAKAKNPALSLLLNNLYPMPKELEETQAPPDRPDKTLLKKYGADNWYDWRIKHWGTKWDVEAELIDAGEEGLVYQFDSAWSPPFEWLKKVAKDYPKLRFRLKYDEPGVGVMGVIVAENGEINYKELTY